jgi:hypothetical protein
MAAELGRISYVMKLLSLLLLGSIGLSASDLGPVASVHDHDICVPTPFVFKATPNMSSCPYTKLIGGYRQECFGFRMFVKIGPGFGETTYRCSLNPSHVWASR